MNNINGSSQSSNFQNLIRNQLQPISSESQPNCNFVNPHQIGFNSELIASVALSSAAPQAPRRVSDQFPTYMRPTVDRIDYNICRYLHQISQVWNQIGLNEHETTERLTNIEQVLMDTMKKFFTVEQEGLTTSRVTIEQLSFQMRTLSNELGIREPEVI